MKFYRIDDQVVLSDKVLSVGEEVVANTTDGAFEKHVPVVEITGDTVTVKVGSVEHPSMPEHYIEWILLVTEGGFQIKYLKPGMKPEAVLLLFATSLLLALLIWVLSNLSRSYSGVLGVRQ